MYTHVNTAVKQTGHVRFRQKRFQPSYYNQIRRFCCISYGDKGTFNRPNIWQSGQGFICTLEHVCLSIEPDLRRPKEPVFAHEAVEIVISSRDSRWPRDTAEELERWSWGARSVAVHTDLVRIKETRQAANLISGKNRCWKWSKAEALLRDHER